MKYEEDQYLVNMVCESNEEVRDSLYEKYEPTIHYYVLKFSRLGKALGLDTKDLLQEANLAFTDAINNYDATKNASLRTFISVCVQRKLVQVIRKAQTAKKNIMKTSVSLDQEFNGVNLGDLIGNEKLDPYFHFEELDNSEEIKSMIQNHLSEFELKVINYTINGLDYKQIAKKLNKSPKQIDNTMQRVRIKVRELMEENQDEKGNC